MIWLAILSKAKIVLVALKEAWSWVWENLKSDSFARVSFCVLLACILGLGIWDLLLMRENAELRKIAAKIKPPKIVTVDGKPVTVTQWRIKIEHSPGWDTYVDPQGNLTQDKFGFRFIPFGGVAYSGDLEPYGGISWFTMHKFHLQSGVGRDKVYPIGLSRCLPFVSQGTVNLGLATPWEWKPGLYGGFSILTR